MRRIHAAIPIALAAALFVGTTAKAADPALDTEALLKEIETLKEGQAAIQKELEEIKGLLRPRAVAGDQAPDAPQTAEIQVAGSPYMGEFDAAVTVIEFSDYQCPFCFRHFQTVVPELKTAYMDSGKVKYVMREFPIESIHPAAMQASQAALCAGEQDRYWEMHDLIFENQQQLRLRDFVKHADALDMDEDDFEDCVESGRYEEQIRNDLAVGSRLGVRGTPSFFVGLTDPEDPEKVIASRFIRGAQPYQVFQQAIEELLKKAENS